MTIRPIIPPSDDGPRLYRWELTDPLTWVIWGCFALSGWLVGAVSGSLV
jgi:hypothetical protein